MATKPKSAAKKAAPEPAPRLTLEQMASRVWKTSDEVTAALKKNGHAETYRDQGYKLTATGLDSWTVHYFEPIPEKPKPTITPPKKSAAKEAPPKPADPPVQEKREAPRMNGSAEVVELFPDVDERPRNGSAKKAEGKAPAKTPAKEAAKQPAAGKKAAAPAKQAEGRAQPDPKPAPERQPDPVPAAPPSGPDLSALPAPKTDAERYSFVIEPEHVRQNGAVTHALDVSRKLRVPVQIVQGRNARPVRAISAAEMRGARRTSRGSSTGAGRGGGGDPHLKKLEPEILKLALRKQGVKRTEMSALNNGVVINWKYYLIRIGKPGGYDLRVDKTGETPVYWLFKPGKP